MIPRLIAFLRKGLTVLQTPGKMAAVASRFPRLDRFSRRYFSPGRPDGLSEDELRTICTTAFGSAPETVSHQHISGWKASGAYRLFVHLANGDTTSLVFKNDVFDPATNSGLDALPLRPGPPEYDVYRSADGPLAPYLPTVYLCDEVRPGRHYRYVLGDLRYEHHRGAGAADAQQIARALPALHRALRAQWPTPDIPATLLRYHDDGREPLLAYFRAQLHRYTDTTGDETARRLLHSWMAVERTYLDDQFYVPDALGPIHGDLNPSNVHFSQVNGPLKIVDWEWAGIHLLHADLASVLRSAPPEDEHRACADFAAHNDALSMDVHRALYQYCKLERGLLDAAYVAGIHRGGAPQAQFDLHGYIRGAAGRALDALDALTQ